MVIALQLPIITDVSAIQIINPIITEWNAFRNRPIKTLLSKDRIISLMFVKIRFVSDFHQWKYFGKTFWNQRYRIRVKEQSVSIWTAESKLISVNANEVSSELVTKNVKLRCHQFLLPLSYYNNHFYRKRHWWRHWRHRRVPHWNTMWRFNVCQYYWQLWMHLSKWFYTRWWSQLPRYWWMYWN